MKTIETRTKGEITRNQVVFIGITAVSVVAFYALLHWAIEDINETQLALVGGTLALALLVLVCGKYLYAHDSKRTTRLSRSGQYRITPLILLTWAGLIYNFVFQNNGLGFLFGLTILNVVWLLVDFGLDRLRIKGIESKKIFK